MNQELTSLLEWLSYDATGLKSHTISIKTVEDWTNFTRRVCFFMNHGSKNLYQLILPADNSIKLHCQGSTYVMKLALEFNNLNSLLYEKCESFGWVKYGDSYHIVWDEQFEEEEKKLNKKRQLPISKCSCTTGCKVDGQGCKNCCKACKACNNKCACKGVCQNPHNNGGTCSKCCLNEELDLEEANDEDVTSLAYEDLTAYFDQDNDQFIQVPCINNSDSESDCESNIYTSDESDTDL